MLKRRGGGDMQWLVMFSTPPLHGPLLEGFIGVLRKFAACIFDNERISKSHVSDQSYCILIYLEGMHMTRVAAAVFRARLRSEEWMSVHGSMRLSNDPAAGMQ